MKLISLFSGCGGLDLGFKKAGFKTIWANEFDNTIWETFRKNFPETHLDTRSIVDIPTDDIPEVDGMIGGPPCQSWSLAGAMRGLKDSRGKLFFEYLRILTNKQPKFFLAENVPGMVSSAHINSFQEILSKFGEVGYNVNYQLLNATHYGVPQDRKRVIIVGYRKDLKKYFSFPQFMTLRGTLKDAIGDLSNAKPAQDKNKINGINGVPIENHEFMTGGFSPIYMSRNRRRNWDEPSFTIQAGGRHAPLHPSSPQMEKVKTDLFRFIGDESKVRRMSVRECARVQTFPDDFIFYYSRVADGYKMVGNAVPVKMAQVIAGQILADLQNI